MPKESPAPEQPRRLIRRLSPPAVWALSFGCSVGWGAFVMPGTTFLPLAGPLGTALGIALGALVMLVIGVNYHYLMNRQPDAGGTFSYAKHSFGYDHAFLSSWFLVLVYLAILWANATAIPLICRYLFGDALCFGFHYTVAGFDVYAGEILISLGAILVFGLVCLRGGRAAAWLQIFLALVLLAGVLACAAAVFLPGGNRPVPTLEPLFSPERKPGLGVLFIVFLAPWAFAGFESVSHSAEEFRFSPRKSLGIMAAALTAAAAAYILLALVGAAARPEGFSRWTDYLAALGTQEGLRGLPVFYSVSSAIGLPGLMIAGAAAAAGIITGFIGNITAASRLIYAMARDRLLPGSLAALNRRGTPKYAVLLLLLVSLPIPFLGRSAIGWIIDVNTVGVTIAYVYASAAAFREARREGRKDMTVFGLLGVAFSGFFLLYFLIPTGAPLSTLPTVSYLILVVWCVLGFIAFYLMFRRDRAHRLGKSTVIWVVLLLLIFFTSMIWIIDTTGESTDAAVAELSAEYAAELRTYGTDAGSAALSAYVTRLTRHFYALTETILRNTVIQFLMFLLSLLIIFHIYGTVQKQRQSAVQDKTIAEQSSQAKSTFLSNMSHDIRTPMNAIIGYVTLAKREKDLSPRMQDYLSKIEASSDHLLALINDVLEMSRIESGRMELMPVPTDVRQMMEDVRSLFITQMEAKGLTYEVSCQEVADARVLCDQNRMNRVLLNLISNAYKFTPEGGPVSVTLRQTGRGEGRADFCLSVKDTGIGMSPEFAAKVFEAYEREKTAAVENIQGTGLGTAITKSIVELMGGDIEVFSRQGEGSEFVIRVSFPIDPAAVEETAARAAAAAGTFAGLRLVLAEDDEDNRAVEKTLLEAAGFTVDAVENGEDAVELIAASLPGEYAAVLLDIEMPVKNGYQAAKLIRGLKNPALAGIPIVAVSARAFSEDVAAARAAGMNGHIAKPIDMKKTLKTLSEALGQARS